MQNVFCIEACNKNKQIILPFHYYGEKLDLLSLKILIFSPLTLKCTQHLGLLFKECTCLEITFCSDAIEVSCSELLFVCLYSLPSTSFFQGSEQRCVRFLQFSGPLLEIFAFRLSLAEERPEKIIF